MTALSKVTGSAQIVHAAIDVTPNRAVALCGAYVVNARHVEPTRRVSCPSCERQLRRARYERRKNHA